MKPGEVFTLPEGSFVFIAQEAPSGHPFHKDDRVGPCVAPLKDPNSPKPRTIKWGSMKWSFFWIKDAIPDGLLPAGTIDPPAPTPSAYYLSMAWSSFVKAMGEANALKPKNAPFPKTKLRARVVDDDGVLVIASERALAKRYAERSFDYSYPNELLEGMRTADLVAWAAEEEGTAAVAVALGEADASFRAIGTITVRGADALLVLPYSQFTFICAKQHGVVVPRTKKSLCTRLSVPPGTYLVRARRGRRLSFEVFFTKTGAAGEIPKDVPTLA